MYTSKEKFQRDFIPSDGYKKQKGPWLSIGSAIILISLIVAVLIGFWAITF